MWYGQKETDKIIANYFRSEYVGSCVEVGVSDGVRGSNTKHFEDLGWKTLCIDPIPEHVEAARKVRSNVLEVACGAAKGRANFKVFLIGDNNIMSSLSGLKTDERLFGSHGHLINGGYTIEVDVERLSDILRSEGWNQAPDFVSIDTEGTELDVLKGMDLIRNAPKLLVVENNFEDKDIEEYLKCFNYEKSERYFVNDFYVKEI